MKEKPTVWRFALFRRPLFSIGLATSVLFTIGTAGLTYTLYLFLQTALNLTTFDTALAVSPYYIAMILVMLSTFRLGSLLSRKFIIQIGLVTLILGLWSLTNSLVPTADLSQMVPGFVVMGMGAGLVVGQMAQLTLSAASFEEEGESSGIYNTLQDLGYSFGICIFGTGLIYLTSSQLVDRVFKELAIQLTDAERDTIVADLEHSLQLLSMEEQEATFHKLPIDVQHAIDTVSKSAEFSAMRYTLWCVAIVIFIGLVVSIFIPKNKNSALTGLR